MTIHRTTLGGGLVLLAVLALIMLAGCTEEPTTINWTATDGLEHYR